MNNFTNPLRCTLIGAFFFITACGPQKPPPGFAPDPGLLAQITGVTIEPVTPYACPGGTIATRYSAVLDNGTTIPFSTTYDEDDPPLLHVVMLSRTSPDAYPRENGYWSADADPLRTIEKGFRLSAFLKHKPAANGFIAVAPEYSCLPNAFDFVGPGGEGGGSGYDGPDVTVRLGKVPTPFYDELLVAGIEVGVAPPRYVLADPAYVPPADWLSVVSAGGPGGHGIQGREGAAGADGEEGCPGTVGGAGGPGGNGGSGGPGGRGGRITVIVPDDEPYLAGMVQAFAPGGNGGEGGLGGEGGDGGKGGKAAANPGCKAGPNGAAGQPGAPGVHGADGPVGPFAQTLIVPADEVFGPRLVPALASMLEASRR